MKNKMIAILMGLLCAMCPKIKAETYFVSKNDPRANDSNIGSISLPWKTLSKAQKTVVPGDTVMVRSGIYFEMLKPVKSGTPEAKIAYKTYPGELVVLDGQNSKSTGVSFSTPASYIRIEGFEVKNYTGTGIFFQDWGIQSVKGIEIVNCKIHDCKGDAISARNSVDSLIEGNEIYDNGLTAVCIAGKFGSSNLIIRKNNIYRNSKDGIQGGGIGILIEDNKIYDQFMTDLHQDALDLSGIHNLIIRRNIIWDTTQNIYIHDQESNCSDIKIYENIIYTNKYFTVKGCQSPAIFFDARFNKGGIKNIEIYSNTLPWVGYTAVRAFGNIDRISIKNNIFYESGIAIGSTATNVSSDYNLFFRSETPSQEGIHSIFGDPLFTNYSRHENWNFNLLPESPAIRIDIGAIQYSIK